MDALTQPRREVVVHEGDERAIGLSVRPATNGDRRVALVIAIAAAISFAVVVPFARVPLSPLPAIGASFQSALAISDVITAILLFTQFAMLRSRALLLLAGGYLFTAGAAVIHAVTIRGLFAASGLFDSGPQTTAWLYMAWHGVFPLLVIAYALLKREDGEAKPRMSPGSAIAATVLCVVVALAALVWLADREDGLLPILLHDDHYTAAMVVLTATVSCLSLGALILLWVSRPHSALDVWLAVVMCAWIFDVALSAMLNGARFDLGFYADRLYGLLAASFVLGKLLVDAGAQQAQLLRILRLERLRADREREGYREREQRFSAVVDSSSDAIIATSLDGEITSWNSAAENLFGFTAQEALSNSVEMIVPPHLRDELRAVLDQVGKGIAIRNYPTTRLAHNGTAIDISLSASPIRAGTGEIVGVTHIVRDVGEARRTERALRREAEERLRIFETSQDLIVVTDTQGNFVQVSPSALAIVGYRPEEMVGRSAVDFIYPGDLESTRNEMRAARRGNVMRNFVTRYVHRDGRPVALTWMGTWSEPVRRFFFIGRDMTEVQATQEELLESERMARRIIETALDAFVQMDDAGVVMDWNSQAERIFGWSRVEAIGQVLSSLIIPEPDRTRHDQGLRQYLVTGQGPILGTRIETEAVRRDGTPIKVELSITAFERRGRHIFNGFLRDVTGKIAAEAQFRQAQKMEAVGQLTGGVAHDFNNMLTVILGTIEILSEGVADRPQLAMVAKLIEEAAERGADLTRHLLAFARRQPLQPRDVDVNELIITTGKLLRPTLGEHIEIETLLADDPWLAYADPSQLSTAILNLSLNARDAMPHGGKLILETLNATLDRSYAGQHSEVVPGQYVLIAISDTGIGIPAESLEKIFEPFFTTKEFGKGTGLGLSMVYGFVKQSGGHIKVYSEEGHGTTVKLYLPRSVEHSKTQLEPRAAPKFERGTEFVLVVEDDTLVRDYVIAQIGSLGYRTLSAASAEEALRIIHAEPAIDLLFTDVIMPGEMNGRQLVDEALKLRPALKVLYTSGYTENAIVHQGRLDPGVLLLAKPYRKQDLARMLRMAIAAGTPPA
jgi:PAS domain S-box-containing protein